VVSNSDIDEDITSVQLRISIQTPYTRCISAYSGFLESQVVLYGSKDVGDIVRLEANRLDAVLGQHLADAIKVILKRERKATEVAFSGDKAIFFIGLRARWTCQTP
jgi:hypothetical protein